MSTATPWHAHQTEPNRWTLVRDGVEHGMVSFVPGRGVYPQVFVNQIVDLLNTGNPAQHTAGRNARGARRPRSRAESLMELGWSSEAEYDTVKASIATFVDGAPAGARERVREAAERTGALGLLSPAQMTEWQDTVMDVVLALVDQDAALAPQDHAA